MSTKLSIITTEKLNTSIELLDKIFKIGQSALDKFPTAEYSFETFFFITHLERFTHNIGSINLLLKNFKEHTYVETSIGLTIRASLLDFMGITYLLTYQADIKSEDDTEGNEMYDKQFSSIMTDQINSTLKYIKLTRDNGILSSEEYKTIVENLWYTYHFLFIDNVVDYEKPESKLISTVYKSPKQYFTRIHNHPLTKQYSMVYDLYTYYSKYEHFGIMTHFMQRENIDTDCERIIGSMKYIIRGIGSCFLFLSHPDNKLINEKSELQKLQDEFDSL